MEITNAANIIINDHDIDDTPQEQMECAIEVLATGNIDSPKTMIDDSLSSKLKQSVPPARGDRGSSKEAGNQDGSATATLAKKLVNGIIKSRNSSEILANVDGVPKYLSRKEQVENVYLEVLKYTMGSDHQTVDG